MTRASSSTEFDGAGGNGCGWRGDRSRSRRAAGGTWMAWWRGGHCFPGSKGLEHLVFARRDGPTMVSYHHGGVDGATIISHAPVEMVLLCGDARPHLTPAEGPT